MANIRERRNGIYPAGQGKLSEITEITLFSSQSSLTGLIGQYFLEAGVHYTLVLSTMLILEFITILPPGSPFPSPPSAPWQDYKDM